MRCDVGEARLKKNKREQHMKPLCTQSYIPSFPPLESIRLLTAIDPRVTRLYFCSC